MARRPQSEDVVEVTESRVDATLRVLVEIPAITLIFLRFHGWADLLGLAATIVLLLNLRDLRRRVVRVTSSALEFRGRSWTLDQVESVHFRSRSFWRSSAVTVRMKDERGDVYVPPASEEGHRRIVAAIDAALPAGDVVTRAAG